MDQYSRILLPIAFILLLSVPVTAHIGGTSGGLETAGEDDEIRPYGDAWIVPVALATLLTLVLALRREFVNKHFHAIYITGLCWFFAGALADGYNHLRGGPAVFVNLEHSIAYSGVILAIGVLFIALLDGWLDDDLYGSIPDGYRLALLSPFLFLAGGGGDMVWHSLFGFEVRAIQMLSPTHLLLAVGALFIFTAPLRHAWFSPPRTDWREQFPMLLSATLLLSGLTFMIQQFHPFVRPISAVWYNIPSGAGEIAGLLGISAITLNTIFMVGLVLLLLERFDVVPGGFTFLLGINAFLMSGLGGHLEFTLTGVLAGLATDGLYQWYRRRPSAYTYRAMAATIPLVANTLYFATIAFNSGIGWTVHVWSGVIGINIGTGLLMSYLVQPVYDEDGRPVTEE